MSSSESVVNENLKRKRNKRNDNSDTSDGHSGPDSDDELENADGQGPVLSHAEKRRRKREAKRAEKLKDVDVDDHPKKKRKLKDGTSQIADSSTTTTTTKRQNSVWVGNLSFKTQHENLQDFFKWAGEITRIHMPTKVRGGPGTQPENRGCVFVNLLCHNAHLLSLHVCSFAYVDFATPEAKIAAVALSEQPLLGRRLLIKDGMNIFSCSPKVRLLNISSDRR